MNANSMLGRTLFALMLTQVYMNNVSFGKGLINQAVIDEIKDLESEFDCKQLIGKLEDASPNMMAICETIMSSEIVQRTKEYLRRKAMLRLDEDHTEEIRVESRSFSRQKRSLDDCPEFTNEYLRKYRDDIGMRSLSPYRTILDSDPLRLPRMMLLSECLCKGCINPSNGKHWHNFNSMPVEVEQNVFYKKNDTAGYVETRRNFTVGCTCVAPNTSK